MKKFVVVVGEESADKINSISLTCIQLGKIPLKKKNKIK